MFFSALIFAEKTGFGYDFYRLTGKEPQLTPSNAADLLLRHHIRYVRLWRRYQRSHNPILRLRLYGYTRKYGLEISPDAKIGKGLYLGHPYNITVAAGTVLGDNVNLHKGCTIGIEVRGKRKGVPSIGDRVSIGINATVVGRITIGDDVMIAPNSFVNFDVPSHSVVVGNPGVIHHRDDATESYVCHIV